MPKVINAKDHLEQIEQEVYEVEEHVHNRELWVGNGASEDSLTPYQIISGNGVFGTEVLILDTGDTPFVTGKLKFDLHRVNILDLSSATVYLLRFIWGTGTVAAAETAKQYTTVPIISVGVGSNISGTPSDLRFPRIDIGTKVWCKCKNATNLATIDLLAGLHEYDR